MQILLSWAIAYLCPGLCLWPSLLTSIPAGWERFSLSFTHSFALFVKYFFLFVTALSLSLVLFMFVPPEEGEPPPSIPRASHKGDHWPLPDWIRRLNVFFFLYIGETTIHRIKTCFRGGWCPTSQEGTEQVSLPPPSARSCSSSATCRATWPNVATPGTIHFLSEFQLCGEKPWGRRSAGRLGSGWGRFWGAGRGGWSCRSPAPPTATTWTARRYARSRSGKKTLVKILSGKR